MHTPETCSTQGCHEPGAEVPAFHTCTCGQNSAYELLMGLAIQLDQEAEEIAPTEGDDLTCTYGCTDKTFDEVQALIDHAWEKHGVRDYHVEHDLNDDSEVREAEVLYRVSKRIAAMLNASKDADTEGSASSQHYIETGVRLPVEPLFFACASCGKGQDEVATFVVTTLDYDNPRQERTEMCVECWIGESGAVSEGLQVQVWRAEHDDVRVVQIDTPEKGRLRVNVNDGMIYDGDPEVGGDVIRAAALNFLHGNDPEGWDLGALADALGVDRGDVEALS